MKAEKDIKTGKWLIQYRYTDWQGNRKKVSSSIMRKFVYKSGRTPSAQGRETCP